jgi:hypothetical protein
VLLPLQLLMLLMLLLLLLMLGLLMLLSCDLQTNGEWGTYNTTVHTSSATPASATATAYVPASSFDYP